MSVICTFLDFLPKEELKDPCLNSITSSINYLDNVLPDLEDTEAEIQQKMGLDNFNMYTNDLRKSLRGHKKSMIDAIISYAQKEFPAGIFNKTMLTRFAFYMKPFDAETFIQYIRKAYADTDLLLLEYWQYVILSDMVGGGWVDNRWISWQEKNTEDIKDINSAGIELNCYSRELHNSQLFNIIIKFSQFVFGDRVIPLGEYEGWKIGPEEFKMDFIESGKSYSTQELKSVRYYDGKHCLKLGFKSIKDRQKFKEILLAPAWETLGREKTEPIEIKDACDICQYKDVLCLQCHDYSAWVGSCQYCTYKKEYPGYRSNECEDCSTGGQDHFVPIETVQHVSGLVKEDGYCKHSWKARKFKDLKYLKIHCFNSYYRYKHYTIGQYKAPICSHCRMGITEQENGTIRHVCTSKNEKMFVYNCRKTLANRG